MRFTKQEWLGIFDICMEAALPLFQVQAWHRSRCWVLGAHSVKETIILIMEKGGSGYCDGRSMFLFWWKKESMREFIECCLLSITVSVRMCSSVFVVISQRIRMYRAPSFRDGKTQQSK
jgi:hypothetical protein